VLPRTLERTEVREESVSGSHARIFFSLSCHASMSMSGGGVGGITNAPDPRRMPAVSPTKATRDEVSKYDT
jgi:hypothetical protein